MNLSDCWKVFIFAVSLAIWDILFIGNTPLALAFLFIVDSALGFMWLTVIKEMTNKRYLFRYRT